ncbi:gamma-glutamyltransferase [Candidatus Bipolaricaulota bacterium]|nr:gamma-glutamyltransferase [Candidatus Bipolaricaulota bacterium]
MSDQIVPTFSSTPRAAVRASHAMVASSQPLAVETGLDILKAGGTAVDAAIAVNSMLGLVEPMSCGIGGDVFAIVWDAKTQTMHGLNGSGRSPGALSRQTFSDLGCTFIPSRGPLSWSIPGCVDGWFTLHERFGRVPMHELLQPAIETARAGFAVTPVIARLWKAAAEQLTKDPGAAAVFLPNGRALQAGETFRNEKLGAALALIAERGNDAFYRGPIAEELVTFSSYAGGYFSLPDFANHSSSWVDSVSVPFRGYDVWQLPPNTQGLALLQMLRILDPYDLASMEHNSAEYLHLLIEAKKLAYEDRARFYADPDFFDVPIEALLSEDYVQRQRSRIDPLRPATEIELDDPRAVRGDTVYLTVIDEEGNAVSFIQSIFNGFGSCVVPPELGFALQNRGSLFHLDPNHANAFEPNKRPFHTIMPGFVTRGGAPAFSFGVMGGDMQPQGQLQVLLNLIEFSMDPQMAGEALRFRHDGSSTPVGHHMSDGGGVHLEPGMPDATIDGLHDRGHRVETTSDGYGGYQGIWIDQKSGELLGGSEPRKDGCALGY